MRLLNDLKWLHQFAASLNVLPYAENKIIAQVNLDIFLTQYQARLLNDLKWLHQFAASLNVIPYAENKIIAQVSLDIFLTQYQARY